MKHTNQERVVALIPLAVFLLLFAGTGIVTGDFYAMPVVVAFMIAGIIGILDNRKEALQTKIEVFCKGAGNTDIMMMCMIFLFAGAFSSVAKAMGAVDATVKLSLGMLPEHFIAGGLFVVACFISIAMGTSVGTITALTPIGLGVAQTTGMPTALLVGAIVSGSMFGDNLSMISDTTIAAVRTQGCELKDKFRVNFLIVLPAAIITIILLTVIAMPYTPQASISYHYKLMEIIPYIAIFVGALLGTNVFVLLGLGIILAGSIGLINGSFNLLGMIQVVADGMKGMQELVVICMVVGGTLEVIKFNGGIDYLMGWITKRIKTEKGAELGIAALVSVVDLCTANNTIAIVMAGPLAKEIGDSYQLESKRTASLLDIFSSCWQGLIPYGAQLLGAAALTTTLTPVDIIPYVHYPMLMGISGLIAIFIRKRK